MGNFISAAKNFVYHSETFIVGKIDDLTVEQYNAQKLNVKIIPVHKSRLVPIAYTIGTGANARTIYYTRNEWYTVLETKHDYESTSREHSQFHVVGTTLNGTVCEMLVDGSLKKIFDETQIIGRVKIFEKDFIFKINSEKYFNPTTLFPFLVGCMFIPMVATLAFRKPMFILGGCVASIAIPEVIRYAC